MTHSRTSTVKGSDLVLFEAPDSIGSAEALLTCLVQLRHELPPDRWPDWQESTKSIVYRRRTGGSGYFVTDPLERSDARERWLATLATKFTDLADGSNEESFARALGDDLCGIVLDKGKAIAAAPLLVELALLQNDRGMYGHKPPKYGIVLEQMYALGGGEWGGASRKLCEALRRVEEIDAYMDRIGSAVRSGLLPDAAAATAPRQPAVSVNLDFNDTPYSWFREAWDCITSQDWVAALPSRRWLDWAGAVLRLAFGMGTLWESRWYAEVGYAMRDGTGRVTVQDLVDRTKQADLLAWRTSPEPKDNDVWRRYRQIAAEGYLVRNALARGTGGRGGQLSDVAVGALFDRTQRSADEADLVGDVVAEIPNAYARLGGDGPVKRRTIAVESALKQRQVASASMADHYYVLRESGKARAKSVFVEPSTEIAAVIASLACVKPGESTTVSQVARRFSTLGIRHEAAEATLATLLERCGLCRRAFDADGSLPVSAAFEGSS